MWGQVPRVRCQRRPALDPHVSEMIKSQKGGVLMSDAGIEPATCRSISKERTKWARCVRVIGMRSRWFWTNSLMFRRRWPKQRRISSSKWILRRPKCLVTCSFERGKQDASSGATHTTKRRWIRHWRRGEAEELSVACSCNAPAKPTGFWSLCLTTT